MYSSLFLYLRPSVSVPLYSEVGESAGSIELPLIFRLPVRQDLIKRVYLSEFTMALQPKGRDPMAGKRTTAKSLGIGYGLARVPRIKGSRRAAFVGFAVGGMATFPPRVEARIWERVNRKEKILGTMSALAATSIIDMVRSRGHRFKAEAVPVVLSSEVLRKVSKTRDAVELLDKVGVYDDIVRASEGTRWRAGKGKMRGRRYKEPKGPLVIVEDLDSPFALAVRNLPGVDVATARAVSVLELAPGAVPGRLAIITTGALEELSQRFKVSGI